MTTPELSPRQRQLAAASAAAMADARAATEARRDRTAAIGDRYLLAETAKLPVEWVLLERHRKLPAFLAVLADTHPLVGSADVAISSVALRLRGRATAWIEESALDSALRVGALDRVTIERARRRILESEQDDEPVWFDEVDTSPEYQEWRREVIDPALAAVRLRAFSLQATAPPRNREWIAPLLAAAAALLLAVHFGWVSWVGWQQGRSERDRLASERRQMEAALESERSRQEEAARLNEQSWQRRVEEAARQERERVAQLQRQLTAREKALLNVPVAILNPAELLRGGEPKEIRLAADAPYLTIALNLDTETEHSSYRAILRRQGDAAPLWQSDELKRQDHRIQFSLAQRLFSPGPYRFDLYGLNGEKAEHLGEYEMTVVR